MKNKKIAILWCLIAGASSQSVFPMIDFIDDISFDSFNEPNADYDQEIAHLLQQTRASDCETPSAEDLVSIAVGPLLNLPNLLQYNIYKYTYPPVIRSLHDLPSLRPWYGFEDHPTFYGTFFYNEMAHAYFTRCGKTIADYLYVSSDDAIIQEFENLIPDIPTIIPLFNNARLQQRRFGVMLGASHSFNNWRFNAAIPLYYLEYNFFLTQAEIDALNATPFFNGGAPVANFEGQNVGFSIFDPNTFINRHLISDKVGLGDIRLYLNYDFFNDSPHQLSLGGQLTLPNNTVIEKAIIGNSFNTCYPGPGLSIAQLIDLQCLADGDPTDPQTLTAKNQLAAVAQSYALQFLDRLSATVLENQLGQRYVSYGFLAHAGFRLTHATQLCIFVEWDQFVKGRQDRPVRLAITPSESLERDYTNPALANDNLTFLQQRTINILFPPIANLEVKEGDIFKARLYTQTTWRVVQWDIGYDLWLQGKEQVINCTSCALPNAQLDTLSAAKPAALQGKLFGHFNVIKEADSYENFSWRLGIKGENTVNNYGIGKDWLVGIDFVADF